MMGLIIVILVYFCRFLEYAILIRCLLSWIRLNRNNVFISLICLITDPVIKPFSKMLKNSPLNSMMIDFSPFFAMIFLQVVQVFLIGLA